MRNPKDTYFRDTLSPERYRVPHPPHFLLHELKILPTIAQSQADDLKLQTGGEIPLRYWVSRLEFHDRPQLSGGTYEGAYPVITIEAYLDGNWVLIDGYQGHMIMC